MATTTNYSWTTPDDTDLVKDGAAAIRTLGSAIDTTVFNNAGAAIAKTIVDAKGDLIVASAADTPARLAVGTNGYVLTADSAETTGLKWATPAAGGKLLQVVYSTTSTENTNTTTTYADSNLTGSITPSSATSKVLIIVTQIFRISRNADPIGGEIKLLRGSTDIFVPSTDSTNFQYISAGGATSVTNIATASLVYLDSPNTTSSTTYKTQHRPHLTTSSGNSKCQPNTATSSICLMEIGA